MATPWRFGLIVTGEGERGFLPLLFGAVHQDGLCVFEVIRQIGQRNPRTAKPTDLRVVGTSRRVPTKDETDIGLAALSYLQGDGDFVIVIDDLESARHGQAAAVFQRYRAALDAVLDSGGANLGAHASVHFLVMMLEAYYFADPDAVNSVLGTHLDAPVEDVETIRHPKGRMKDLHAGFDEVSHGERIVRKLRLDRILDNPSTCKSLRTLVDWCLTAMGVEHGNRYRLQDGERWELTKGQAERLLAP